MKSQYTHGFTLIELLIVIAIIGILASVLIASLLGANKRSYDASATACAKSLQTAQAISWVDNKSFLMLGSGAGLNNASDAVNQACLQSTMFVNERSVTASIQSNYILDVWDGRGKTVFTVTPSSFTRNAPGATPFSTSGTNLP